MSIMQKDFSEAEKQEDQDERWVFHYLTLKQGGHRQEKTVKP